MLNDFRKFIMRGNVVDLAVAVVMGAAFGTIVSALVKDIITPLIGAIGATPNFSGLSVIINHSRIMYGDFLNAIIAFLLLALTLFFFVVRPINKFVSLASRKKTPADPADKKCTECLSTIPRAAKRCAFCASLQP